MKTIYLILVLMIISDITFAQNITRGGRFKVKNNTYIGTNNETNLHVFRLRNEQNKLFKDNTLLPENIREHYFQYVSTKKNDVDQVLKLLKEAFLKEGRKLPNENIFPTFYIKPDGKILEIDFVLKPASSISSEDIYLIEKTLIGQYTFKTNADKLKEAKFIKFSWPIKFENYQG